MPPSAAVPSLLGLTLCAPPCCHCSDADLTFVGFSWDGADEGKMVQTFGAGRALFSRFVDLQRVRLPDLARATARGLCEGAGARSAQLLHSSRGAVRRAAQPGRCLPAGGFRRPHRFKDPRSLASHGASPPASSAALPFHGRAHPCRPA